MKKKKRTARPKSLIAAAVCAALFIGGTGALYGTFAYLTDNEIHVNPMDVLEVRSDIIETFPEPEPPGPGSVLTKTVRISSTGADCFARVQVLFSDSEMEALCTPDYNTADWTFNEADGWWYCNDVLKTGTLSEPLFETVTIDPSADASVLHPFDIIIRHESRQAEGHTNAQEALGA